MAFAAILDYYCINIAIYEVHLTFVSIELLLSIEHFRNWLKAPILAPSFTFLRVLTH